MKVKLYLFLGLFFTVTPVLAVDPITAIGMGVSFVSSIFGGAAARRRQSQAERLRRRQEQKITALEATRQEIPDFLAGGIENPFANLQVATRAAEMQAEQQDISLASTLDVLRSTGASAGGATALARAASQSKRGVAAQIEQQEARNAQLRAQGEMQATQMRQRGQQLQFAAQERREMQQLNRASSLASSASQQAAAYGAQSSAMFGQAIGTLGSFAAAGGFGKSGPFAADPLKQEMRFQQNLEKTIAPEEFDPVAAGVIKPIEEQAFDISDINVIEPPEDNIFFDPASYQASLNAPNFGNTMGNNFINNLSQFGLTNQQFSGLGGFRFP